MNITSTAFVHNGGIPFKYTCDGEDMNPPLVFSDVPRKAKSLVLMVDDPDAPGGTWVHWLVWDMDPAEGGIKENNAPGGSVEGMTSSGKTGYGGPCPPSGTHRYFFKLFALDSILALDASAGKEKLEQAMRTHILERAELIGLYSRAHRL